MIKTDLKKENKTIVKKINGVVIGVLLSINDDGIPLIAFPGNPKETALQARSTAIISKEDIGCEVALLFEGGEPGSPLIIGKIQKVQPENKITDTLSVTAKLDDDNLVLSAKKSITLKCGKASISLTKSGKVILRGAYLLSRSSGVNRIKGGSVQLN